MGIDLGTTYSCVGVWQNERVEIIANEQGNRTTPSYVAFTDTERLIGDGAKSQVSLNPTNTVFDAKRLIGRMFDSDIVQKDMQHWPFKVIKAANGQPKIKVTFRGEAKYFYPEEVSAMVLVKMKAIAEAYLAPSPVSGAVITVPAYFNDSQRQATKDAGKIAGLNVLRIINEPTAAAIAYGLDRQAERGETNILVFDLGGGTFDVSLLGIEEGVFQVKAVAGDSHLGGEDFDNRVVDFICEQFALKNRGKDLKRSERATRRLRTACERAKRALSNETQAFIEVDNLMDGIDFSFTLTRAKLEDLCLDFFKSCLEPVNKVLRDAQLSKSQVHEVVLVGGSTRIPKVQKLLSDFFNGKDLCKDINQDEAVAYGAAVQAAILSGVKSRQMDNIVLLDVTPLSLGVEAAGGVMAKIIKRNTTVPVRQKDVFTTNRDDQDAVDVVIFEGERQLTKDNNRLGQFTLGGIPPMPRGVPLVEVTLDINADGILAVHAKETSTGVESQITITQDKMNLSSTDIDRMVREAEESHAADTAARAKIDARNALQAYAYELAGTVRNEKVAARIGDERVDEILELVADAVDWLDDHPNADEEVYANRRFDLKTKAKPLLGIRDQDQDGGEGKGAAAGGAAGAAGGGGAGKGQSGGGGGGGAGASAAAAAAGGSTKQAAPWRKGPNGCIVEPVD